MVGGENMSGVGILRHDGLLSKQPPPFNAPPFREVAEIEAR